jgi:hypothetical protein
MNEKISTAEYDPHSGRSRGEFEREGKFTFEMIQRGDFIKPGWWHWRCRREGGAGDVAYGYVQADPLGLAVVQETFEKDRW